MTSRFTALGLLRAGRRLCWYVSGHLSRALPVHANTDSRRNLTLTIAAAIWAWMRMLEADEPRPQLWASVLGSRLGCGLLLKGLIAGVFPVAAVLVYMALTRQLFSVHPGEGSPRASSSRWLWSSPRPGTSWRRFATRRCLISRCTAARRIPRLFLVLFLQRTSTALFESALSARLQHGAARSVLAVAFRLALSLVGLSGRHAETRLLRSFTGRARGSWPSAGSEW